MDEDVEEGSFLNEEIGFVEVDEDVCPGDQPFRPTGTHSGGRNQLTGIIC